MIASVLVTSRVQAQPASEPPAGTAPGAAPPGTTGAELSVTPAPEAEPAGDPKVEQAKQHFRQAVAFAEAGDCGAAIVEFEAAYELVPRPNALYNIAQCEERLFRYDLAIRYYERYLQEAPSDAPDRPAVNAALSTLRNLLGTVVVNSNVPAEVWVDDRLAGEAPGDVLLPSGGHSLELRAKGYIPARAEVRLVGRQRIELALELEKAQTTVQITETTGLDPTLFWIGTGATAVTAVIGVVFAGRVVALKDDALELPEQHPDRSERREEVEGAELTADIFFASAALLAVGTTIVAFVTDWDGESSTPSVETGVSASARLRVAPVVLRDGAGLSLGGTL
jgi:tetratricopeptide (TPR) repeat protein